MRIRKRQVPLPLSSLLPVPLSDLYSNRSPTATASYFCGEDRDGVLASLLQLSQPPAPVSDGQQRDVIDKKQEKALDDDGVKSSTDASGSKNVNPRGESDSSTQVVEKNENVITLRKRRRGFISFEEQEDEDDEEEEEEASGGGGGSKGKKKAKKRGALEEGSRCSRVNGRVRSMNKSAGGRGGRDKKKAMVVEVKSKRVKLGMVKARSISSLLGQTSTSSGTVESEISAPADQFAASDK
ncbi:hypothetical protein YC2023_063864 [Brassica napus]